MTEGYAPATGTLDDAALGKVALTVSTADEVLDALRFGMTYRAGKNRSREAHEIAIGTVAQMVYDHLLMAGFVIMKKPPVAPHKTHGFKKHLTE